MVERKGQTVLFVSDST